MVDDIYHVSEMVVLTNITDLIPEVKEQVEVLSVMASKVVELFDRFEDMRGSNRSSPRSRGWRARKSHLPQSCSQALLR